MSVGTSSTASHGTSQIYRINVAVQKLGVSRSTVYRLINAGDLQMVKIGKRSSGITAESLAALIEKSKAAPAG